MYPRSELLFPHRCVSALKRLRDRPWQELVERIARLPETHEDSLAFSLMMIKLCNCLKCDLGSYKASLGCCACAQRAVNGHKGSDKTLLRRFAQAKAELRAYLEEHGLEVERDEEDEA